MVSTFKPIGHCVSGPLLAFSTRKIASRTLSSVAPLVSRLSTHSTPWTRHLSPSTRHSGLSTQLGWRGYSSANSLPETVDVIVLDPRLLFRPFTDPLDPALQDFVIGPFPLPRKLVESGQLSEPSEELDSYQPINSFYFGDRSEELFEYSFLGNHQTESDYTALAVVDKLDTLKESGLDWDAFKQAWKNEGKGKSEMDYCFTKFKDALPFLGNLETAYGLEGAACQLLKRDGVPTGLLINSIPGESDD